MTIAQETGGPSPEAPGGVGGSEGGWSPPSGSGATPPPPGVAQPPPPPAGRAQYPPPAPTQAGPSGPRAGFWARFGAALLDGLIVGIVTFALLAALKGVGYGLGWLLGIAYFIYFEGGPTGQTLGKRAVGIRVVSFDTGGPIGYGRAAIRYFGRIVSSIAIYIGYLWMLWDREKQTWHDKFANDVVVPVAQYPVQR